MKALSSWTTWQSSLLKLVFLDWVRRGYSVDHAEALSPLFGGGELGGFLQQLDFVEGGFEVVRGALLYFDGDVGVVLEVSAEPHGGKVAPSELLDDDVAVDEHFAG